MTQTQSRRLLERGGHGLFALPGWEKSERHPLAEAARRVPGGVICLLTALRFHGLTTQYSFEVRMAIEGKGEYGVAHPFKPLRSASTARKPYRRSLSSQDSYEPPDA